MVEQNKIIGEDSIPEPEYLIKSIAEQGYSLETSLADLMDNSISANADKIEILVKMETEPFILFLADNGDGMDDEALKNNMKFPSNSPEIKRNKNDLGRFGLGMKTASFSQTRCFTVLSRKKGMKEYCGRTWDVDYLKEEGWKIIINEKDQIKEYLLEYEKLSHAHLNKFENFSANTIIIWKGLYKFENYLAEEDRKLALKREINDVTNEHLSIVFHRFMENKKKPLKIRVNNIILNPFNPFPNHLSDFRSIPNKQRNVRDDVLRMEGFVLPSRSIGESKSGVSEWTTKSRGLMEMEGLYIYRSNRLIRFGDWNGVVKKSPRLQLARLMVEVGNGVDHLLHLNVAKSQITIPYDLRQAFLRYVIILKEEAEKEYYNNTTTTNPRIKGNKKEFFLFNKIPSSKGMLLAFNEEFPLLRELRASLSGPQKGNFNLFLKTVNTSINKIRQVHEDRSFNEARDKDILSESELFNAIDNLILKGVSKSQILESIIPNLGYSFESLPSKLKTILKNE